MLSFSVLILAYPFLFHYNPLTIIPRKHLLTMMNSHMQEYIYVLLFLQQMCFGLQRDLSEKIFCIYFFYLLFNKKIGKHFHGHGPCFLWLLGVFFYPQLLLGLQSMCLLSQEDSIIPGKYFFTYQQYFIIKKQGT